MIYKCRHLHITKQGVKRVPVNMNSRQSVNDALKQLMDGDSSKSKLRFGKLVDKALFGIVLIGLVFQAANAYGEISSKGFSRGKITELPNIVLRNDTVKLRFWIFDFFRVTGDPAVAGLGYGLAQSIGEYFERHLDKLSYKQRVALFLKLKRAIYPAMAPQSNAVQQGMRPVPVKRPATSPELTSQDLERLIYMDRLRRLELKDRLKQALGLLRRDKVWEIATGSSLDSTKSIKEAQEEVARLRRLIQEASKRIETYRDAQKEPNRRMGEKLVYPPIIEKSGPATADVAAQAEFQRRLKKSTARRDDLLQRLNKAKHWEYEYLKRLRRQLGKVEENMKGLKRWIDTLNKFREKDNQELHKIVTSRPKNQKEVEMGLLAMWADLHGALRRGVDVWALARRHEVDFSRPVSEQLSGATLWEVNKLWDGSILVHDDLYGSIQELEGKPASGPLMLREPREEEFNRPDWNFPGAILEPFQPILNPDSSPGSGIFGQS